MWFCESQPTIETDSPNNSTSGSELGVFGTVLFSSISLVDSRGKKERPVLPLALLMWAGQDHPQGWLTRKGCAQRTPLVAESLKTLQCRRPGFSPRVRKIPGEGNSNPLPYSCLGNPSKESYCWIPWTSFSRATEYNNFYHQMGK